jgi:hypothetical protein
MKNDTYIFFEYIIGLTPKKCLVLLFDVRDLTLLLLDSYLTEKNEFPTLSLSLSPFRPSPIA